MIININDLKVDVALDAGKEEELIKAAYEAGTSLEGYVAQLLKYHRTVSTIAKNREYVKNYHEHFKLTHGMTRYAYYKNKRKAHKKEHD